MRKKRVQTHRNFDCSGNSSNYPYVTAKSGTCFTHNYGLQSNVTGYTIVPVKYEHEDTVNTR